MMESIRENKRAAFLLLGALIALVLAGVYYLYIMPLQVENETKRNANALLQTEIVALQEQAVDGEEEVSLQDDPYELMKKVPTGLEMDKIISTIEEIELVTGTRVKAASFTGFETGEVTGFTEEEDVVTEEPEQQAEDPTTDPETPETGDSSTEAREEASLEPEPQPTILASQLPLELRMITMTVDFEAETEEQLIAIMKEIENLERVYRVDGIDTGQPGETQLTKPGGDPTIQASFTISTFYYVE